VSVLERARGIIQLFGSSSARLERRVAKMRTGDLVLWTESSTAGIGKAFGDWQQTGERDSLDEARMGTAALLIALDELERRRAAGAL
jgi:hypothetical protein